MHIKVDLISINMNLYLSLSIYKLLNILQYVNAMYPCHKESLTRINKEFD